jgi:transposase
MEAITLDIEMRCVIKFYVKRNKQPTEIYAKLQEAYGELCMTRENIYYWVREFRRYGRESVTDAPRTGRPATTHTEANIQAVKEIIEANRRSSTKNYG